MTQEKKRIQTIKAITKITEEIDSKYSLFYFHFIEILSISLEFIKTNSNDPIKLSQHHKNIFFFTLFSLVFYYHNIVGTYNYHMRSLSIMISEVFSKILSAFL